MISQKKLTINPYLFLLCLHAYFHPLQAISELAVSEKIKEHSSDLNCLFKKLKCLTPTVKGALNNQNEALRLYNIT